MRLLRLEALHFGKLEQFVLEPQEGLNRYCRPNEFGKTTLIFFIYYMLYGYDARLLKGYLPWDGSELAGRMTFLQGGKEWRIERRRKSAEKRQILCLTDGEELVLAQKEQPGTYFLGLDGATFLKTFCIAQGDLIFSRTDGLDVALKNMVATGDENVSYKLAEDWLNKEHTKYKYRGKSGGLLTEQQEELTRGTVELQELSRCLEEQLHRHREWEQLEREIPLSDARLQALQLRLAKAEGSDALRLLEQLDALQQQQPSEPPAVSKEKLDELEQWLQTVEETRTAAQRARESLAHLEEQGELAEQNVRQFGFPAGDDANWARLNGEKRGLWWLPALCGGAMAAAGFAAPAPWRFILWAGGGLLVLLSAVLRMVANHRRKKCLLRYGVSNMAQLQEKRAEYRQASARLQALQTARKEASEEVRRAAQAAEDAAVRLDRLREETRLFGRNDLQQQRVRWGVYEAASARKEVALQEQALLNGRSRSELETLAAKAQLQEETAPQVRRLLEEEQQKNRALRDRREQLDPRALEALWNRRTAQEARVKELKTAIRTGEARLEAVNLALNWLQEANREMNTRFAPQLCSLAGEYLARLTNGKYQRLLLDSSFGIMLETAEGTYPPERFSAGTRDAVWFAFRLAVSRLLAAEPMPMVLDDPFVNLDADRRAAAENLLNIAAKERQILYFTCRE